MRLCCSSTLSCIGDRPDNRKHAAWQQFILFLIRRFISYRNEKHTQNKLAKSLTTGDGVRIIMQPANNRNSDE